MWGAERDAEQAAAFDMTGAPDGDEVSQHPVDQWVDPAVSAHAGASVPDLRGPAHEPLHHLGEPQHGEPRHSEPRNEMPRVPEQHDAAAHYGAEEPDVGSADAAVDEGAGNPSGRGLPGRRPFGAAGRRWGPGPSGQSPADPAAQSPAPPMSQFPAGAGEANPATFAAPSPAPHPGPWRRQRGENPDPQVAQYANAAAAGSPSAPALSPPAQAAAPHPHEGQTPVQLSAPAQQTMAPVAGLATAAPNLGQGGAPAAQAQAYGQPLAHNPAGMSPQQRQVPSQESVGQPIAQQPGAAYPQQRPLPAPEPPMAPPQPQRSLVVEPGADQQAQQWPSIQQDNATPMPVQHQPLAAPMAGSQAPYATPHEQVQAVGQDQAAGGQWPAQQSAQQQVGQWPQQGETAAPPPPRSYRPVPTWPTGQSAPVGSVETAADQQVPAFDPSSIAPPGHTVERRPVMKPAHTGQQPIISPGFTTPAPPAPDHETEAQYTDAYGQGVLPEDIDATLQAHSSKTVDRSPRARLIRGGLAIGAAFLVGVLCFLVAYFIPKMF